MPNLSAPLVSVIMSVYNGRAALLCESIESILNQEFRDFEFLIIDDGSDGSVEQVVRRYADPRIRFLRNNANLGLARSLNRGIEKARGLFIARQDADDRSDPRRLGLQVEFLQAHPEVGLVGTAFAVIDETGRRMTVVRPALSNTELQPRLRSINGFMHGSVMMRRLCVERAGGYRPFPACQDYDLWLRMSEQADVENLPEALYEWRLNPAGISVQRTALQMRVMALVQEFAEERRQRGVDSFDRSYAADGTFVGRWTHPPTNPWNIPLKEAAVPYLVVAGRFLAYGDWRRALGAGFQGLMRDPWNPHLWSLAFRRALTSAAQAQQAVSVLLIVSWSFQEPNCQRALEPLLSMVQDGYRFHVITFERPPYRGSRAEQEEWTQAWAARGVAWHPLAYHHRPLLLAKLVDGVAAAWTGWRLIQRESIRLLHARSEFPATIAGILAKATGVPMLYENDAMISEERADVGLWRRDGLAYRVTRAIERRLPEAAQEMIVLSSRYADRLRAEGVETPLTVLPRCADIDHFRRDPEERVALRHWLGWEGRLVVVYSGSLGGWYRFDEMAAFIARLKAAVPQTHWLCLVNHDPAAVRRLAERSGVPGEALTVRSVAAAEVPRWLAASDIGLSFIEAGTSKFASSPKKFAEYLACGLPIIMTPGIGDSEALLAAPEAGHLVARLDAEAYDRAIAWIAWITPRLSEAADTCRRIAVEQLSLQRTSLGTYRAIYQRLVHAPAGAFRPRLIEPVAAVIQPQEPSHAG